MTALVLANRWKLASRYVEQACEAPARPLAGEGMEPGKVQSAMEAWTRLTSRKRSCFDLETLGEECDELGISKFGGTPLFSKAELEQWPICQECGDEMRLLYQIFQSEVPSLLCPKEADMMQIFWCPNDCGEEEASHHMRWLASSAVTDPIKTSLGVPLPSRRLLGEEHDDYLDINDVGSGDLPWLDSGIRELQFVEKDGSTKNLFDSYDAWHSRGNKIGGYPYWIQEGWRCCHEPLYVIAQIGWAEGYQYILGCLECGKLQTEYQGS